MVYCPAAVLPLHFLLLIDTPFLCCPAVMRLTLLPRLDSTHLMLLLLECPSCEFDIMSVKCLLFTAIALHCLQIGVVVPAGGGLGQQYHYE